MSLNKPSHCWICGSPCLTGKVTCSDTCHEILINWLEHVFGVYKQVVDIETGKHYKVPVRDIVERGLKHCDLVNYPEMS